MRVQRDAAQPPPALGAARQVGRGRRRTVEDRAPFAFERGANRCLQRQPLAL